MGGAYRGPGALIGAIQFTAANPAVLVGEPFGGLSVEYAGSTGNFTVSLPSTQEIDADDRLVMVGRRGATAAFASELDAGSDSEINILVQALDGTAANNDDVIKVAVYRLDVGE